VDNWWQTETGWPMAANCLGLHRFPVKPGSPGKATPGWDVQVLDPGGIQMQAGMPGAIVARLPLPPGTLPTLWNNEKGYQKSYLSAYEGFYETGDAGYVDEDGYTVTLSTCNCALRRESFGRFGIFDGDFPTAAGEDTVFARNLRALGGRIRFCPDMEVEHSPMTSMATFVRRQYERGIGNYFIKRKLGRVMPLIGLRFWSTKNMILRRLKDPGLPVMLCLLVAAFFLQQLGFLRACLRYGAMPGVRPWSGPRKKKEVA